MSNEENCPYGNGETTCLLPLNVCPNKESKFLTHHSNQLPGQLCDENLTGGPHIIDLTHNPLFQNQQEGIYGIIDIQKMAGFREGSLDGTAAQRRKGNSG